MKKPALNMKNLTVLFLAACLSTLGITACKNKAGTGSASSSTKGGSEYSTHLQNIYNRARKTGDPYTQLYAINALLEEDSVANAHLEDSAAMIYVALQMAKPAVVMAERVLARDPENSKMLEIKSSGSVASGKTDEAIALNMKLYQKEKKLRYLFQIAMIHLSDRDFNAVDQTLNEIQNSPNFNSDSVDITDQTTGQVQMVPVKAALPYMRGGILIEKNDPKLIPEAMKDFKTAISIFPGFVMAKRYMAAVEEQSQQMRAMQQQQNMAKKQQQQAPPPPVDTRPSARFRRF
jgi:hypothetical protein